MQSKLRWKYLLRKIFSPYTVKYAFILQNLISTAYNTSEYAFYLTRILRNVGERKFEFRHIVRCYWSLMVYNRLVQIHEI